jgi:hypothetical protein
LANEKQSFIFDREAFPSLPACSTTGRNGRRARDVDFFQGAPRSFTVIVLQIFIQKVLYRDLYIYLESFRVFFYKF